MNAVKEFLSSDAVSWVVGFGLLVVLGWFAIDKAVLAPNDPCRAPNTSIEMCNSLKQ